MIERKNPDQNPLQPIRDFDRNRVEQLAARLLEVGELRDLLAVEPDFPAEAPRPERRRLPLILDEADVVAGRVDADRQQRLQVDLLRIPRIGFKDHLKLVVLLQTVGILAVAGVIWPDGRFDVGYAPRFRPEDTQEGGRVHRARPDLGVVGLPDQAAPFGPEMLQGQDDGLHRPAAFHLGLQRRPRDRPATLRRGFQRRPRDRPAALRRGFQRRPRGRG